MHLKVKDINNIMEEYAPIELKESFDNVGLMIGDERSEVTSILVALDCTLEVIKEAKAKGCNLILTHHPPLFLKPASITTGTLTGKKVLELIKNNINVYSSHTNLDSTEEGLNDIVTNILGFNEWSIISPSVNNHTLKDKAGIGRIVQLKEPMLLKDLCDHVKEKLETASIRYCGEDNKIIEKLAIINGSGEDFFEASRKNKVDCIITGDTTYHYVSDINELGIAVIDGGHFETEWPAMKIVAKNLEVKLTQLGFENKVYISESCRSPYKFR